MVDNHLGKASLGSPLFIIIVRVTIYNFSLVSTFASLNPTEYHFQISVVSTTITYFKASVAK
jgi:hypothetical protein